MTPLTASLEVEDAKRTTWQRCYIRFNLPIAFALVVPKASTPTMPDSTAANFTVISSSEVTRATAVILVGSETPVVGYYCLGHLQSSIYRMQGGLIMPESLIPRIASFESLSYATIFRPYPAFL